MPDPSHLMTPWKLFLTHWIILYQWMEGTSRTNIWTPTNQTKDVQPTVEPEPPSKHPNSNPPPPCFLRAHQVLGCWLFCQHGKWYGIHRWSPLNTPQADKKTHGRDEWRMKTLKNFQKPSFCHWKHQPPNHTNIPTLPAQLPQSPES